MQFLALDTSTEYLSLAIWRNGDVLSNEILAGQTHSQVILPRIAALLAEAELSLPQLDGIAFGAGPGSFTGLRIGCGVAQGLAFAADLPVASISTLLALTSMGSHHKVIACLDARMGEVYHAAYERKNNVWETIHEAGLYKPESVPAVEGNDWQGIGSGWQAHGETLQSIYADQCNSVLADLYPHAKAIAALAAPIFAKHEGQPAAEAMPIYVRNKVAFTSIERAAK